MSNAVPAAYFDSPSEDTEETRKRRIQMCPEEWKDTFGDEFYDYALENSFFFLAPRTEWKADSESIVAPGLQQFTVKTEDELTASMDSLRNNGGYYD